MSDSEIKVRRFDRMEYQYITTGEFTALQQMCTEYPTETRTLIEDILRIGMMTDKNTNQQFLAFFQDSILQKVARDTEERFANMDKLNGQLTNAFLRLCEMFPEVTFPTVYSQITALDQSIVIKDGSIGISLDKYLGEDYPVYARFFNNEERERMNAKMIVPDCVLFYMLSIYPLENFQTATQEQRDRHIGKMLWIANNVSGFRAFTDSPLVKAEQFMAKHPSMTPQEFMEEYK